jgi:hypothetical protein
VQVPRPLVDLAGYESLHSSQLDDTSSNPNGPSPRQSQIDSPDQKVGRRQQILHHHSLGSPLSSLPAQPLTRGIPSSPLVCSSSLQYISSSFESLKEVKEEDTLLPVSDQLLLNDSSSPGASSPRQKPGSRRRQRPSSSWDSPIIRSIQQLLSLCSRNATQPHTIFGQSLTTSDCVLAFLFR